MSAVDGRPLTVEGHMGLVHREVRRWARRARHMRYEDLVQEGAIGLIRGLELFRPELGFSPATYLSVWIRQAITRAIQNKDREIRMPVYALDRARCQGTLEHEKRRSLSYPIGEHGLTLEGVLPSSTDVEGEIHDRLQRERLERALVALGERYRFVLLQRMSGRTLKEIAGELRVSRERARQLQAEGLALLRRWLGPSLEPGAQPLDPSRW